MASQSPSSTLCTSCGLCCSGALHQAAVLDEDEVARARAIGLPVLNRAKLSFAMPCPKLKGTCCTIYGNRPRVCSRYRCDLLQRLEDGRMLLEDAVRITQAAKPLVARLQELTPAGMTLPEVRAAAARPPSDTNDMPPELRIAATAVAVYIDKHFRNAREGKLLKFGRVEAAQETAGDEHEI